MDGLEILSKNINGWLRNSFDTIFLLLNQAAQNTSINPIMSGSVGKSVPSDEEKENSIDSGSENNKR